MTARHKLNSAAIAGCVLFAALIGYWAESLVIFIVAAAILLGLSVHDKSIRL